MIGRSVSASGHKAKFPGDQRVSALASEADISRFMSTRPSQTLGLYALVYAVSRVHLGDAG
jgi:hypothetical protein